MKNKIIREDASIFFEILRQAPEESKRFVSKTMAIARQLDLIMSRKGISQKELAKKLNKTEPEISKWLAGDHNFTIRTLTAIETALDEEILVIPVKQKPSKSHTGISVSLPPRSTRRQVYSPGTILNGG
jgi:ribosome-binding protein aMBF1 (putative translation factor)